MTNSSTQKKLLAEKDLSLQRAVDIATAAEMAVLEQQQGVPTNEAKYRGCCICYV